VKAGAASSAAAAPASTTDLRGALARLPGEGTRRPGSADVKGPREGRPRAVQRVLAWASASGAGLDGAASAPATTREGPRRPRAGGRGPSPAGETATGGEG
jgi:hypothetical protein